MAHHVRVAEQYVEVQFSGEVDPELMRRMGARLTPEETAAVRSTARMLFDFSDIESFGFNTEQLGQSMQRLASLGVRLAVYSSNSRFFAIGRQIALYSGLEGDAIAVFNERPELAAGQSRLTPEQPRRGCATFRARWAGPAIGPRQLAPHPCGCTPEGRA
ncbi:MAG TPA: hypothetical protein PJ994_00475 [Tepidiformaceae bacterium]|nr:hypothetical protein [Tepidiformaceae bacterium]